MGSFSKIILTGAVLLIVSTVVLPQVSSPAGLWKFDDNTNIVKADVGNNLEIVGSQTTIDGPNTGNNAVKIGRGSYLKMHHGILPNEGGTMANEYTIQIDFRIPQLSNWYCFFQTNPDNSNDGDCFINPGGNIGVQATGYSTYSVLPNQWYRLVITVKNGTHYKYYLDGQLIINGFFQAIDGRFALDSTLLLFADDNGEDSEIDCAEAAIWNYSLSYDEVKSLGDYGHSSKLLVLIPYLQMPTSNSIYISWHDSTSTNTKVDYGTTTSLGLTTTGTSEVVSEPYIWHTVKLTGLQPNTEYFYKVSSGGGSSEIYSFRTQPLMDYSGKIRFLILSDTHASDTTMAVKVIKEAKKKMQQLYGNDYYNFVNMTLHSGDLVVAGYDITQWTDQYFAPMSPISPNIPTITVPGNHEGESNNYYAYMKYDDISAYPSPDPLNERFWSIQIVNTVIIGINSNLTNSRRAHQTDWLDTKLAEIESDPSVDFVIVIVHHLPISELWGEGMSDSGSLYVKNQILPILKKYSKIIQLSYGHTHGYERGTIETETPNTNSDFRIVCGGGGGGPTDRWGVYENFDYQSIHISFDHYFYQIVEIDATDKTFESYMFSLGNSSKSRDSELMDYWYRKVNQEAPQNPEAFTPVISTNELTFNTSGISADSIMTTRIQITDDISFKKTVVDTMIHWKNIYGVDSNLNPVDLHESIDLTKLSFNRSRFLNEKNYFYKVQYRDHNLKWSGWSNIVSFNIPSDIDDNTLITRYELMQNYPNPFNSLTKIIYQIPRSGFVTLKVYDLLGNEITALVNKEKRAGRYEATFDGGYLSSGVYFYKIQAGEFVQTKKFILIK